MVRPIGTEDLSPVLKRRSKDAATRRKEIMDAALHLFGTKGFHETTMDDVARAAGVAKGTIYLYYASKERILLALKKEFHDGLQARTADVIADAIERLSQGEALDYRDVIDDIFDAMVSHNVEHREAVEIVGRQNPGPDLVKESLELERELLQLMAVAFRQAMQAGLIHTTDPEMLSYLINAAIRDNIVTCLCYEEPASLERLGEAVKELLYKALAPQWPLPPRRPRVVRLR